MAAVSVDALHRSENLNLHRFLLRKLGNPADAADAAGRRGETEERLDERRLEGRRLTLRRDGLGDEG